MSKIDQLINIVTDAIYDDRPASCLDTVLDELRELRSKLKSIDNLHRDFLEKYYTATETSDSEQYRDAAIVAKSLQYQLKKIDILPNLDEEIRNVVVQKVHG